MSFKIINLFQKTLEHTIDAYPGLAVPYLISPNDHYAPVIVRSVKSVPLLQKAKNGERIEMGNVAQKWHPTLAPPSSLL